MVRPRTGFELPIRILDAINPYLVLVSIAGLIIEYTPLKAYVIVFNQVIDLLFVADFLTRLICFPIKKYFVHGWGWVDFLASLPGFTLILQYTPIFAVFKFIRIGRFFKIVRVLRFLRIFNFLKRMKSDSVFVQDRIMRIGVAIVLVFVAGLVVVDLASKQSLETLASQTWQERYAAAGSAEALAQKYPEVAYYSTDGKLFRHDGSTLPVSDYKSYDEAVNSETQLYLEVPFDTNYVYADQFFKFPHEGILVLENQIMYMHDGVMLTLIVTLVALMFFIIFYVGYIFARDMRVVHLIVDSIDAEDYMLLQDAAEVYRESNFELESDEDEITSLLKMAAKLTSGGGPAKNREGSMDAYTDGTNGNVASELVERLAALEAKVDALSDDQNGRLEELARSSSRETIRRSAVAIVKYIKSKYGET